MKAKEVDKAVNITGVVIPTAWDKTGQITGLGIASADEATYAVAPGPESEGLKKMLQREVTIWGRTKGEKPNQTIIVERVEMKTGKQGTKWSLVAVAMICAGLLAFGGAPPALAAQQSDVKTKTVAKAEKPAKKAKAQATAKTHKKKAVKANAKVKSAQEALTKAGFKCAADGIMGKKTRAAIKGFQKKNKLKVTGKLDKATRAKLGI